MCPVGVAPRRTYHTYLIPFLHAVEKVVWKERGTVCADTRRSVPTAAILALDLTRLAPD